MLSIAPCRSQVSDRFPVASFDIALPDTRYFEVACATDPRLFHSQWQKQRTTSNFFTSRDTGLLRAPQGRTAWFLPPDQLRRFAGAQRIYYALASYGSPNGAEPQFTISPNALEQVPSISVSGDFTGRALDRSRLPNYTRTTDHYGSPGAASLRWGGDDVLEAEQRQRHNSRALSEEYDDGHAPDLWTDSERHTDGERTTDYERYSDSERSEMSTKPEYTPGGSSALAEQAAYDEGVAHTESLSYDHGFDAEVGDCTDEHVDAPYGAFGYGEAADDGDIDSYDRALDTGEGNDDFKEDADEEERDDTFGGYEDAAALYGAVGYGSVDGGVAVATPPAHASASDAIGVGRDADYREEAEDEEELPAGSAARALDATTLDIPEKVRIIRVIAVAESGRDGYSAINPDNEYNDPHHPAYHTTHIGLSWGLIQFTQRSGALGRVLRAVKRREESLTPGLATEQRFENLFGPSWEELLRVTNDSDADRRVEPVGGALLWEPTWTARFRAAGNVPHVQWSQNEIALTDYFDPQLRVAGWLGFDTPRALAMLVDRCIHMGSGGGVSWVMRAVGPVQTQADRDNALRALGHADLRAFQSTCTPHLSVDGRWGPRTHAALTAALRNLGSRSPLAVPDRDTMLQRMVDAARSTNFARRVRALHENRTDFADTTTYALG